MAPNSSNAEIKDGFSSEKKVGYSSETKDGSSSETKDVFSTETKDGSSSVSKDGSSTETKDGFSSVSKDGSSTETKDGFSSETKDGSSTETKDGSSSETKDGSSNEQMEISTGIASSFLGKRKAETLNLEDSSESEDDEESSDEEEVEVQEEDSGPEWDKDSFDELEYNSPDDDDDEKHPFDSDEEEDDKELKMAIRRYRRKVIESKGFYEPYTEVRPFGVWSGISPLRDLEQKKWDGVSCREFLAEMASQCVAKYNKHKEKNVKFEHILRANFNPSGRTKFYITFAARESDSPEEPLVEYQAKGLWRLGTEKTYPILCRPSPPKKAG